MPHAQHQQLAEFAENGDGDAILRMVGLDEIAQAWCDYHSVDHDADAEDRYEPDWWAVDFFYTCWDKLSAIKHEALLHLIDCANGNKLILGVIGAGPFEDWFEFDLDDLSWIEVQAAKSVAFRRALANAILPWDLPDDMRARVHRAARLPRHQWLDHHK